MRMIMLAAAATGLGTAGYMGGAFEGGEYYEMAPADVSQNLARMAFPHELDGAAGDISLRTVLADSNEVRWDIVRGSYSIAEIKADLTPSGVGTRVSVDFAMLEGPEKELLGSVAPMDSDFLSEIIEIAMTEQIDSTLENRPFDQHKMSTMMASYIMANPHAVAGFQQSINANLEGSMEPDVFDEQAEILQDYAATAEESFNEEGDGGWAE